MLGNVLSNLIRGAHSSGWTPPLWPLGTPKGHGRVGLLPWPETLSGAL